MLHAARVERAPAASLSSPGLPNPIEEARDVNEPVEQTGEEVTAEMIQQRAYEISQREDAGTPEENWERAERELRGEQSPSEA
jgi:hypothetical protein